MKQCNSIFEEGQDRQRLLHVVVLTYAASIASVTHKPNTFAEAVASKDSNTCLRGMKAELSSHIWNNSWNFVAFGTATRPIGRRWKIAKKRDENGRVIPYKARLIFFRMVPRNSLE
uniref:Putative polyprotein n=1 Tax=Albugo laibachii Nc14 TaxID=890382 RepID=F0W6N7_9STRA|nr:putative polyprotein [Albugo laibachii Nc14]|eukprot:CCA16782.1 putative polyprotein [Albugo laibachii Nc14]